MNNTLGDPSLASALNSRYNGSLVPHQATIYNGNALPQSGSPVPQVYTAACKPEGGYWHQGSEYNVNPVSEIQYQLFFFLYFLFLLFSFVLVFGYYSSFCAKK